MRDLDLLVKNEKNDVKYLQTLKKSMAQLVSKAAMNDDKCSSVMWHLEFVKQCAQMQICHLLSIQTLELQIYEIKQLNAPPTTYTSLLELKETIVQWLKPFNPNLPSSEPEVQFIFNLIDHFMLWTSPNKTVYSPKKEFKRVYKNMTDADAKMPLSLSISSALIYCDYMLEAASSIPCAKQRGIKFQKAYALLNFISKLDYNNPMVWKLLGRFYAQIAEEDSVINVDVEIPMEDLDEVIGNANEFTVQSMYNERSAFCLSKAMKYSTFRDL